MKCPRLAVLTVVALLGPFALSLRLYQLTVVRHHASRERAERRCRRVEILPARRGRILDREERPLAVDRLVRDIALDLTDLDPALNLMVPLGRAFAATRVDVLAALRRLRGSLPVDMPPAVGPDGEPELGPSLPFGWIPLDKASRARRHLDRHEEVVVDVTPRGLLVAVHAEVLAQRDRTLRRLAPILGRSVADLDAEVRARVDAICALEDRNARIVEWRKPLVLAKEAGFDAVAQVRERAYELTGVTVRRRFERRYPQGPRGVHVVGYTNAPTAAELRRAAAEGLLLDQDRDALGLLLGRATDLPRAARLSEEGFGRTGVEAGFDGVLRGTPGARVVIRDVKGHTRRVLHEVSPRDGQDLRLALDLDLQVALEDALDEAVARHGDAEAGGAAVVLDLRDGGVLAMASAPRYDANLLGEEFRALAEDVRKPLLHRAVRGFAPGSTFKVLSSFALFEPGHPDALPHGWTVECTGRGGRRKGCDSVHGRTGLTRALERSCNVFYFDGVQSVGLGGLDRWSRRLGLRDALGLEVFGEQRGSVPAPGYKRRRALRAEQSLVQWSLRAGDLPVVGAAEREDIRSHWARASWWFRACVNDLEEGPGDAANASIGQGDVLLSPMHVAFVAATVATGGRTPRPRMHLGQPVEYVSVNLDPRVLGEVREGMRRCVSRGTASSRSIGLSQYPVAGKTGTAERGGGRPLLAWFMGYYPADRPEIAFAVLVDRTRGHGGDVCGPVARAVVEAYMEQEAP